MSEKIIKGRLVQKHDTAENWSKATSFVPKQGEVIIYDKDSSHNYERVKVGDGTTVVSALPFIDDNKVDKIAGKGLSTNDYTTDEKNKLKNDCKRITGRRNDCIRRCHKRYCGKQICRSW